MLIRVAVGLLAFVARMLASLADNEIRPQVVHGYPCIKRLNQLYCPSPGRKYPTERVPQVTKNATTILFHTEVFAEQLFEDEDDGERVSDPDDEGRREEVREETRRQAHRIVKREKRQLIDTYIDENKSMVKRMFGEYTPHSDHETRSNSISTFDGSPVYKKSRRPKRSYDSKYSENKVDTCESAVEIVTPYWASNSAGKIRAIVNTQHLQQAVQQEVCQTVRTKRCKDDCSCEQKYKWHRLLAYDPDDDCKGIFMDWFLFPSCCVCRCTNPLLGD